LNAYGCVLLLVLYPLANRNQWLKKFLTVVTVLHLQLQFNNLYTGKFASIQWSFIHWYWYWLFTQYEFQRYTNTQWL